MTYSTLKQQERKIIAYQPLQLQIIMQNLSVPRQWVFQFKHNCKIISSGYGGAPASLPRVKTATWKETKN